MADQELVWRRSVQPLRAPQQQGDTASMHEHREAH